jgi:uncharacterized protein YjiS (DUF1127 family)
LLVRPVKSPGDLNGKSRPPQSFEPNASIGSRYSLRLAAVPRRIDMAELIIPLARRSGEVGTRHLVAGVMARGVERALAGFAERMAARHTIAQLRALDDRTLHDIGLHRSEIGSLALDVGADRIRRRYY